MKNLIGEVVGRSRSIGIWKDALQRKRRMTDGWDVILAIAFMLFGMWKDNFNKIWYYGALFFGLKASPFLCYGRAAPDEIHCFHFIWCLIRPLKCIVHITNAHSCKCTNEFEVGRTTCLVIFHLAIVTEMRFIWLAGLL